MTEKSFTSISIENVSGELSVLETGEVNEMHLMLHVKDACLTFKEQVQSLLDALDRLIMDQLMGATPVFARIFLSDIRNQEADLNHLLSGSLLRTCALSIVHQPPLDGTKIGLWVYFLKGEDLKTRLMDGGRVLEVSHNGYTHLWNGSSWSDAPGSELQTHLLFDRYIDLLAHHGCTLKDNCVRTWFFVHDIDSNYAGMVKARNDVFAVQGLTTETHSIASTGIGGGTHDGVGLVEMDSYAVIGMKEGQMGYLYAPTHLNPTSDYGVSFERATFVDYRNRRQIFISGTASINNQGEIVHEGDIRLQTDRMIENVDVLLKEGGCSFEDVGQMIIYLRDPSDYQVVRNIIAKRFPDMPSIIVSGRVCRPGWLIEMECIASQVRQNPGFMPL